MTDKIFESQEFSSEVIITIKGIETRNDALISYLKSIPNVKHIDELYESGRIVARLWAVDYAFIDDVWAKGVLDTIDMKAGKDLMTSIYVSRAKEFKNYSSKRKES